MQVLANQEAESPTISSQNQVEDPQKTGASPSDFRNGPVYKLNDWSAITDYLLSNSRLLSRNLHREDTHIDPDDISSRRTKPRSHPNVGIWGLRWGSGDPTSDRTWVIVHSFMPLSELSTSFLLSAVASADFSKSKCFAREATVQTRDYGQLSC